MATTDLTGAVLGIGNPLLDICANASQELLDKYEVTLNNAILAEEKHLPVYTELADNHDVHYIAGGATQNSIRVCQWMLQVPKATVFIGSVGNDTFGEQLRSSASSDGVDVRYHIDEAAPTGTCAVLVKDHERSLIANLAAANNYKHAHLLSDDITSVLDKAKIVYIAGFFLTVSPESIMHAAKHCHEHPEKTFVMNLAAPFISQFFGEPLVAALPYCNLVIGNESEADAFGSAQGMEDRSPVAVAKEIAAWPQEDSLRPRVCIITQGAGHTVVVCEGKLHEYKVPVVPTDEIVDVNGAGDAFVGGLLAYLIQGKSLADAVHAGHYAAGYVLRRSGCVLPDKPNYSP